MSMRALKLRVVCIHALLLAVLHLLPFRVKCSVKARANLLHNIGQDVVFMWNTTNGNSILIAEWGLLTSVGDINPQFISIDTRTNVPHLRPDLDTTAVRYKGRVSWVGDLSAGHAWFMLTNLTLQDTNQYGVAIREQGQTGTVKYPSKLTVAAIPSFPHLPNSPYDVPVIEGRDLVINCTAIGPPTPTVQWFTSDGTAMTTSSKTGTVTLTKTNVQGSHSGAKYKCVASNNPNSDPVSTIINVVVLYPPSTTVTPTTVTVVQGDDIVLGCTADGNPPPSISWTKDNGVIKAGHTVAGGTLRIPDAIKTDAGKYICTGNNTYDSREHTDTATTTVIVIYQPSVVLNKLKDHTVNQSESLSIRCDADGYPPPTIKWKTPTGSVHTGNVYTIPSVSRSDAGTYLCTASNGIGREAMANTQVIVQFKPITNESRSSSKTSSWNGNNIRLRCFATGLPTPQITWYRPSKQHITTGVSIVPGGSEVIVLTTANHGDYGEYKCRATNILGSDENVINVTQLFPPGRVNITIHEIEASSITVRWIKPAYDGGLAVTCYLLEINTKPPVLTVSTHAVITRLKAGTQYTVKVYSQNAAGYGTVSSRVIRTKEKGKPAVPVILYAVLETSGSKLSVVLRWEEPDNNGGNITRYTVYIKEVKRQFEWAKYEDFEGPNRLEYKVTENIVYGKTYMFMVTAWNKYGESVKDEEGAKTVNTTASKAISTSVVRFRAEEGSKTSFTVLGIIISLLVLSLGFNVVQFLYLRKRVQPRSRNKSKSSSSGMSSKNDTTGESYENDFELEVSISPASALASRARQPETVPEYETINQKAEVVNSNKARPVHTSDYQELNMLPNTSIQRPVYEPLRTRPDESREQHSNNGQHPYEPLNVRNQNTTYQSLHSNGNESSE